MQSYPSTPTLNVTLKTGVSRAKFVVSGMYLVVLVDDLLTIIVLLCVLVDQRLRGTALLAAALAATTGCSCGCRRGGVGGGSGVALVIVGHAGGEVGVDVVLHLDSGGA
ncbi:hypothetical protein MN608_10029 [Microdochium nivale]|nr:hypothetical protein MN608_10029 [Microdochium nivale]